MESRFPFHHPIAEFVETVHRVIELENAYVLKQNALELELEMITHANCVQVNSREEEPVVVMSTEYGSFLADLRPSFNRMSPIVCTIWFYELSYEYRTSTPFQRGFVLSIQFSEGLELERFETVPINKDGDFEFIFNSALIGNFGFVDKRKGLPEPQITIVNDAAYAAELAHYRLRIRAFVESSRLLQDLLPNK